MRRRANDTAATPMHPPGRFDAKWPGTYQAWGRISAVVSHADGTRASLLKPFVNSTPACNSDSLPRYNIGPSIPLFPWVYLWKWFFGFAVARLSGPCSVGVCFLMEVLARHKKVFRLLCCVYE